MIHPTIPSTTLTLCVLVSYGTALPLILLSFWTNIIKVIPAPLLPPCNRFNAQINVNFYPKEPLSLAYWFQKIPIFVLDASLLSLNFVIWDFPSNPRPHVCEPPLLGLWQSFLIVHHMSSDPTPRQWQWQWQWQWQHAVESAVIPSAR